MKSLWMRLAVSVACVALSASAQATIVNWTDWTSATTNQVTGTLDVGGTSVGITYAGPYAFAQTSGGTNYWTEGTPAPYTGGSVENAPPASDLIALNTGGLKTITFSEAVLDPYIALVSWNGNVVEFSTGIDVISEGCGFFSCGTIVLNDAGDGFTGQGEVHGIIRLSGSFTSISFTDTSEFWHGFTIGVAGLGDGNPPPDGEVPEPAALGLLGLGLIGLGTLRRRGARRV